MTDIVERLRAEAAHADLYEQGYGQGKCRLEAADEIERLTGELRTVMRISNEQIDEIERLRAALDLITAGEPAAAGSAPLSFKEWAQMIASNAVKP